MRNTVECQEAIKMRQLMALMWLTILGVNANVMDNELSYDGTAGSEDIYFQPIRDSTDNGDDEYVYEYEYEGEGEEEKLQHKSPEPQESKPFGDNLDGIGVDASTCEYSCPRYYRPICVRRNGQLITYATPCEYHNQLRCASVAKRLNADQETPTFELMYKNACRE